MEYMRFLWVIVGISLAIALTIESGEGPAYMANNPDVLLGSFAFPALISYLYFYFYDKKEGEKK